MLRETNCRAIAAAPWLICGSTIRPCARAAQPERSTLEAATCGVQDREYSQEYSTRKIAVNWLLELLPVQVFRGADSHEAICLGDLSDGTDDYLVKLSNRHGHLESQGMTVHELDRWAAAFSEQRFRG